jgi:uncharacterized membrane protein
MSPAPSARPSSFDDIRLQQLETRVGFVLGLGVRISSAALAVGLLASLAGVGGSWPGALMTIGLVLLMATPVARVVVSVVEYGWQRDWTFFVLTAIVLLVLCAGIVTALVFHRRL